MMLPIIDLVSGWVSLTENESFAGLVEVLVGAGLLALWFRTRDRATAARDQAVQFLNETGDRLNMALSALFRLARGQQREQLSEAEQRVGKLFEHRFAVRVKSLALLRSPGFAAEYDHIVWQLKLASSAAARLLGQKRVDPPLTGFASLPVEIRDDWSSVQSAIESAWDRSIGLVMSPLRAVLAGKRINRRDIRRLAVERSLKRKSNWKNS